MKCWVTTHWESFHKKMNEAESGQKNLSARSHEGSWGVLPWPGYEPGLSRPQREVLITIRSRLNRLTCEYYTQLFFTYETLKVHIACTTACKDTCCTFGLVSASGTTVLRTVVDAEHSHRTYIPLSKRWIRELKFSILSQSIDTYVKNYPKCLTFWNSHG